MSGPVSSEPDDRTLARLHELRLRGMVEGLDDAALTLVADGMAVTKGESLVLTPMGREAAAARARLPEGSEEEAAARRAYEAFLPLNQELLRVTTDWQVCPGEVPNRHDDPAYDAGVIDRLKGVDERVGPIVRRLAKAVPHFDGYRDRLRSAVTLVEEGQPEWFASPRCDSYHTVWMQLHEDMLLALGLERGDETAE